MGSDRNGKGEGVVEKGKEREPMMDGQSGVVECGAAGTRPPHAFPIQPGFRTPIPIPQ